jgi:hypothetical protein
MTTSNSKIKTHSIGILCDTAGDHNFYFLNASEADMQEMFMEYCRDMVDDSLMEHQFEVIQKDSDNDWYLYHGEMTGDWTKRFSSYLDMMNNVADDVFIDFVDAIEM